MNLRNTDAQFVIKVALAKRGIFLYRYIDYLKKIKKYIFKGPKSMKIFIKVYVIMLVLIAKKIILAANT